MGKDSERTAANSEGSETNWLRTCQAHHVGGRPQEDLRRSKSAVGEGAGGEEESGIELRTRDEKMIPPTYQTEEKVYAAYNRGGETSVTEATILSVRLSPVLLGNGKWLSRPRQPRKDLGFIHQARGA